MVRLCVLKLPIIYLSLVHHPKRLILRIPTTSQIVLLLKSYYIIPSYFLLLFPLMHRADQRDPELRQLLFKLFYSLNKYLLIFRHYGRCLGDRNEDKHDLWPNWSTIYLLLGIYETQIFKISPPLFLNWFEQIFIPCK